MRNRKQPPIIFVPIGSVQDVWLVLTLQQDYYNGPRLYDIPESLHIYWHLTDVLFQRMSSPHVRVVDRGGMQIVEVDLFKLRELQTSLLWLQDTLIDDHSDHIFDEADELIAEHYPTTLADEAERACDIIDVIVEISADNIFSFDREAA